MPPATPPVNPGFSHSGVFMMYPFRTWGRAERRDLTCPGRTRQIRDGFGPTPVGQHRGCPPVGRSGAAEKARTAKNDADCVKSLNAAAQALV